MKPAAGTRRPQRTGRLQRQSPAERTIAHWRRPTAPAPAGESGQAAPALLRLIWLASPALPVGGFSYSEGLEAAVDAGLVSNEASAGQWLSDQLQLTQARSEWPLMASAMRAWQRAAGEDPSAAAVAELQALNTWATAARESAELRLQAQQMGRSLADWLRQRLPGDARCAILTGLKPAPAWPLSCGLAAAATGARPREALLAMAFGWCENAVQSAIKTVPLGQNAGQRLLGRLADALPAAVDEALHRSSQGESGRVNFAPMLALQSARHEAQYSRLFRS